MSNNKTLLFIATHIINEHVINEYSKLEKTGGYDCLLVIDNANLKMPFISRICKKKFYGKTVNCFFTDEKVHKKLKLPYMTFKEQYSKYSTVVWFNCDYRFYYVRKYFPNYEYYWQFEYDVYCNDSTYKPFLDKYIDRNEDLLSAMLFPTSKDTDWWWVKDIDWVYDDKTSLHGCFIPVCRMSGSAADFLYNKRLEHAALYNSIKHEDKQWVECELFVSTELMNNNFSCSKIDEKNVISEEFIIKDNPIFEKPDGMLYHPVKSKNAYFNIKSIISKTINSIVALKIVCKIKRSIFWLSYFFKK